MLKQRKEEFNNFQLCMYMSHKQNNTLILPREVMLHIWKYMSMSPLMQQGGTKVLIAGGFQNNEKSNKTYIFDSETNSWSKGINMNDNIYNNKMTILNDKSILAVGGCNFDYLTDVLKTTQILSSDNKLYFLQIAFWISHFFAPPLQSSIIDFHFDGSNNSGSFCMCL